MHWQTLAECFGWMAVATAYAVAVFGVVSLACYGEGRIGR